MVNYYTQVNALCCATSVLISIYSIYSYAPNQYIYNCGRYFRILYKYLYKYIHKVPVWNTCDILGYRVMWKVWQMTLAWNFFDHFIT